MISRWLLGGVFGRGEGNDGVVSSYSGHVVIHHVYNVVAWKLWLDIVCCGYPFAKRIDLNVYNMLKVQFSIILILFDHERMA
jgi:hypothetical protein